jgi:predicted  nucleic acid-binding Zn-ribbon protein
LHQPGQDQGKVLARGKVLVQAHGAGALATVETNACAACNESLAPNSLVELNTGNFIFCRSCGRLLYRPEAG